MRAVLISTYELGRQPFGLASPTAWLKAADVDVECVDLSREPFREQIAESDFVGIYLPMHAATRLAIPLIRKIRRLNSTIVLCCYGVYAQLNADYLRALGVHHILGGEFEEDLTRIVRHIDQKVLPTDDEEDSTETRKVPRLKFLAPDRSNLPSLDRYAKLQCAGGPKLVGYTEASRGCKHFCRHCPIVPVYGGQFRVVPVDLVIQDIVAQVERGARHISFGDPDFFNGIGHSRQVVEELARLCLGVTYDVTIKVEHLVRYGSDLRRLRDTGCLFVTSAFESFDDHVLSRLAKRHSRRDIERAVELCEAAGVFLSPTFVAFTPWTTRQGYRDLLSAILDLGLVDHVAPIQLAIRLLVTQGSKLLELDQMKDYLEEFDPVHLIYPWRHPDPGMDELSKHVEDVVSRNIEIPRSEAFRAIWEIVNGASPREDSAWNKLLRKRTEVPFLNEPWYC